MAKARKLERLRRSAGPQHGVVTRDQALAAGFSVSAIARAVERGEWQRLHPGIFLVDPAADPVLARVMGAVLRAPDRTWASHRSAAALWGISAAVPLHPEISTTANLRGGRVVIHRVPAMPPADRAVVRGIPLTSHERTLVDLGGAVSREELESAVIQALQKKLTTVDRLRGHSRTLAASGRRGSGAIVKTIERWDPAAPPESALETKLLSVIRRHGLPRPKSQLEVWAEERLVARVDFGYPAQMVAVEVDGYRWHSDRHRWQSDLRRRNALTQLGWRVLHFTWDDVRRRPRQVASTIACALSGRNVPIPGTKRRETSAT